MDISNRSPEVHYNETDCIGIFYSKHRLAKTDGQHVHVTMSHQISTWFSCRSGQWNHRVRVYYWHAPWWRHRNVKKDSDRSGPKLPADIFEIRYMMLFQWTVTIRTIVCPIYTKSDISEFQGRLSGPQWGGRMIGPPITLNHSFLRSALYRITKVTTQELNKIFTLPLVGCTGMMKYLQQPSLIVADNRCNLFFFRFFQIWN